jgi:hypothetical protein
VYAELGHSGAAARSPTEKSEAPTAGQVAAALVILLVALGFGVAVGGVDGVLFILHLASVAGLRAPDDDTDHDAFAGGASGGGGASREW